MIQIRQRFIVRLFAISATLYGLHTILSQYAFEKFLVGIQINFDHFPITYAKALNDSVARHEEPLDFDYPSTFSEPKIPRIIHYIWFKNLYPTHEEVTSMPSMGSRSPELCEKFNPGYEIKMWNATNARDFMEREYKWFLPTYDGYRYPIQRVDALKYFALWHYGGVYIDLDIACRRPLDPLLSFPAWFPEASPLGINNDLMASAKHHPIMKRMTDGLVTHNRNMLFPYVTIFFSTGPHFTSNILQEWYRQCSRGGCRQSDSGTASDKFVVLPRIFYSEEYTFFGHSPGGTWHGSDVAVVLWFVQHPWAFFSIIFVLVGTGLAGWKTGCKRSRKNNEKRLIPV